MEEFSIIDEISRRFGDQDSSLLFGIGDDCAVIRPKPGFDQIVTTDTLVAGVHFPFCLNWEQVGGRNAATALSDIAAMGGNPRYAFSSLHLSKEFSKEEVIEYFTGVSTLLKKYDTTLAGGNIIRYDGPPHFTLTIIGEVEEGKALLRSTAKEGEAIFVAGNPGDAAAGLQVLLGKGEGFPNPNYTESEIPLIEAFVSPEPQIDIGRYLVNNAISTCAIDCSDGFLSDLGKMCEKSGVGALLEEENIPLSKELLAWCEEKNASPFEKACFGGDDYTLVFTVPQSLKERLPPDIHGIPLTEIGTVVPGNRISFTGEARPSLSLPVRGYEH